MNLKDWITNSVISRERMDTIHDKLIGWAAKKVLSDEPDFPITVAAILEGEVIPSDGWEIIEIEGEKIGITQIPPPDKLRYQLLRVTGRMFPFQGLKGAFLISTAWMSTVSASEFDSAPAPRDDPNRREVLIVCDFFRGGTPETCRMTTVQMTDHGLGDKKSMTGGQSNLLMEFITGIAYSLGTRDIITLE
jgi:hypothetical protein